MSYFSCSARVKSQARLADVDPRHPRVGLAQRIGGGLGGTAARDQDIAIWPLRTGRPKQMEQRPAPLGISIELAVPRQIGDRRRIGMGVVEFAHGLVRRHRSGRSSPASCLASARATPRRSAARPICGSGYPSIHHPDRIHPTSVTPAAMLRKLLEHLIDREARGLLARRKIDEGRQELGRRVFARARTGRRARSSSRNRCST